MLISRFFLAFGLLLAFSLPVQAQLFPSGGSNGDFLPVEEAFSPQAWIDGDRLMVGIESADGYYLYRHRLSVSSDTSEVTPGEPVLPAGTFKNDEFLGEVYVFHDRVIFPVPIKAQGGADSIDVTLHYQGCAEAGLCYPPQQVELTALPGSTPAAFTQPSSSPREDTTAPTKTTPETSSLTSEDGQFSNLLQDASPTLVLGLFFLAGLGLTFTPCVLPMMPILASIIVGQRPSRLRAFALSGSYVTGMALTYAGVGVLMGLFGAGLNLQARLQSPAVLIPFAALFVVFALAMFSVFQLRLPARLSQRLDAWQDRAQRSGPLGLALAGALSVLVVSPCVSAPLAGALVFISSTGDAAMGGLGLLALALGMGVPLLIVGTFGATLLPRSGAWMQHVKSAFGVLLLGVAIWLVERLLPGPLTLLLWGALAIGSALALGALRLDHPKGVARLGQAGGAYAADLGGHTGRRRGRRRKRPAAPAGLANQHSCHQRQPTGCLTTLHHGHGARGAQRRARPRHSQRPTGLRRRQCRLVHILQAHGTRASIRRPQVAGHARRQFQRIQRRCDRIATLKAARCSNTSSYSARPA